MHFKKIRRRDLKPENMLLYLLDKSLPIIKIKYMGLSKLVDKTRLSQMSMAMPLRGFCVHVTADSFFMFNLPQRHIGFVNVQISIQNTVGQCIKLQGNSFGPGWRHLNIQGL